MTSSEKGEIARSTRRKKEIILSVFKISTDAIYYESYRVYGEEYLS